MPESKAEKTVSAKKSTPKKKATPRKVATAKKATAEKASSTSSPKGSTASASSNSPTDEGDFLDSVIDQAKGAAYTAVGFGIMATAKAQNLLKEVQTDFLTDSVRSTAKKADGHVESLLTKVENKIAAYEDQLPGASKDLVKKVRTTGQETRGKVRSKVFPESAK